MHCQITSNNWDWNNNLKNPENATENFYMLSLLSVILLNHIRENPFTFCVSIKKGIYPQEDHFAPVCFLLTVWDGAFYDYVWPSDVHWIQFPGGLLRIESGTIGHCCVRCLKSWHGFLVMACSHRSTPWHTWAHTFSCSLFIGTCI